MDIRRHLRPWLNDATLVRLGGSYGGVVASVTEEQVRNPFTAMRQLEPVIGFDEGYRLIPNITMRAALIELFGPHTDKWIGRRITVSRRRIERMDRQTGEVKVL